MHSSWIRTSASIALCSLLMGTFSGSSARADEHGPTLAPERDFHKFSDFAWLALGATSGFVGHELGHIVTDLMTLHHPTFHTTKTGPFYFFAIQPCCGPLSHAEEYAIASAGLVVNDLSSELILSISPRIRSRHAPFMKGVLLVDIGLELGYAISGFVQSAHPKGFPDQSDVASMSRALGVSPWRVSLSVMAPALIDLYRYFVPRSSFVPWVGIQSKVFMAGLVLPLL
ncbi:MAG: hypothetical protein ABI321_16290 [Polyangia bacterium]